MRLLQVSPFTAYPPTGGGQSRVHGLMVGQGDEDTVIRFAVGTLDEGSGQTRITPSYREERHASYRNSLIGLVTGIAGLEQIFSGVGLCVARPSRLSELTKWADIVMVEFPWYCPYVASITPNDTPLIYSSHNFEPEFYAHLARQPWTRLALWTVLRSERRATAVADLMVVTTERDKRLYRTRIETETPIHVAPNGVQSDGLIDPSCAAEISEPFRAIFVGSDQPHNVEAVERILEAARDERISNAPLEFRIVGSVCDSFTGSDTPKSVTLSGFVGDINQEYERADIGLNPIYSGGGSNIKLPEYFGKGLAVITTEFGARGVPVETDQNCLLIRGSLADDLLRLVEGGPELIAKLGNNAHKLATNQLTWKRISSELFDRIADMTDL